MNCMRMPSMSAKYVRSGILMMNEGERARQCSLGPFQAWMRNWGVEEGPGGDDDINQTGSIEHLHVETQNSFLFLLNNQSLED